MSFGSNKSMEKKAVPNASKPIAPPAGLQAIINQCLKIYPDQPNPLQVTTVVKYWLGGQDPLDYISMYRNDGDIELNIPPHWHYVTFGLSDLHGDGRVHIRDDMDNPEQRSGMGFELTFRLIRNTSTDTQGKQPNDMPPIWPANLLQQLARYVFATGNRLCAGDNVPWKKSLDNSTSSIQHMLIASDPQLNRILSPFGWIDFCQIVGVTEEELNQASWWKGTGVLNLLSKDPQTGGEWLITDMARSQSVFELFPKTLNELKQDLEEEGSDLAGINAEFAFKDIPKSYIKPHIDSKTINEQLQLKLTADNVDAPAVKLESNDARFFEAMSCSNSLDKSAMSIIRDELLSKPKSAFPLEGLEIKIGPDYAKYLALAINDRIRHGRHFTLKNDRLALTFISEAVTGDGVAVTKREPYALFGYWLQVLITDDIVQSMIESFKYLADPNEKFDLPLTFEWPEKNLSIIIDNLTQEPIGLE